MCFHDRPTRNDVLGHLNPPALQDGDEILFDECGRCKAQVCGSGSTDYHSHHFRVVRSAHGGMVWLLVRHGGGDERVRLRYAYTRVTDILGLLDSDARYLMIHALYSVHSAASRAATSCESARWQKAAAEKRIKTKKQRGRDAVQVWIEESR